MSLSEAAAARERDRRAVHSFIQTIPDDDDDNDNAVKTTTNNKSSKKSKVFTTAEIKSKEERDIDDAMEDEELDTNFVFDSARAGAASSGGVGSSWSFNAMKQNALAKFAKKSAHSSLDEKIRQRVALRRLQTEVAAPLVVSQQKEKKSKSVKGN
jgi:hypothetical protein